MNIKFRNHSVFVVIFFLGLMLLFLFACFEEEFEEGNNNSNKDKEFRDDIVRVIGERDVQKVSYGVTVLEMQIDKAMNEQALTTAEKQFVDVLSESLRNEKTHINQQTIVGERNYYNDADKTKIKYTVVYRSNVYYSDDDILLAYDWQIEKTNYPNQNNVSFSKKKMIGDSDSGYRLVSVGFEMGVSDANHTSTLGTSSEFFSNILLALQGVSGTIEWNVDFPTYHFNGSLWEGIELGKIKLLDGYVQESQYYGQFANEKNIPITVAQDQIILRFYTEDWKDYDYNDSFITVVVDNSEGLTSMDDDGGVEVVFAPAIQSILNNTNINTVGISYRRKGKDAWQWIPEENIERVDNIFRLFRLNLGEDVDLLETEFFFFNLY